MCDRPLKQTFDGHPTSNDAQRREYERTLTQHLITRCIASQFWCAFQYSDMALSVHCVLWQIIQHGEMRVMYILSVYKEYILF